MVNWKLSKWKTILVFGVGGVLSYFYESCVPLDGVCDFWFDYFGIVRIFLSVGIIYLIWSLFEKK